MLMPPIAVASDAIQEMSHQNLEHSLHQIFNFAHASYALVVAGLPGLMS